ncbi:MarR family transcriptional regulator [Agromyces endophyticus]|uniref:MarR family winged helix-turn-helix transcriptional regulator n=1 Tax=Agromyces sp. H17E-10 TaxID=2932244 RepID=UPI001FD29862|nr:MarR family transcriptional regulator [Agromyces sp. H17E-10]UOQ88202.1 MarR family transcriptional regulator [Agromyces sp. H17E-10]
MAAESTETLDVVRRVMTLANAVGGLADDVLAEFGLAPSVMGVVWGLDPASESPTMRELATRLRCDPSTISLAADRLEAAGFVERAPHPTDGRKRTLALTERGLELWHAIEARIHGSGMIDGLDAGERATLEALLAKVRMPR